MFLGRREFHGKNAGIFSRWVHARQIAFSAGTTKNIMLKTIQIDGFWHDLFTSNQSKLAFFAIFKLQNQSRNQLLNPDMNDVWAWICKKRQF